MKRLSTAAVSPAVRFCVSRRHPATVQQSTHFATQPSLPPAGLRRASSFSPGPPPSAATHTGPVKSSAGGGAPSPGLQFPPRLLIYHAGTWRIVWVASWKLASIAVLAFTSLVVAPTLYSAPELNFPLPWSAPAEAAPAADAEQTASPPADPPLLESSGPASEPESFIDTRAGRTALAVAIMCGGCIPVYYALLTTRPFVAYVHIALPLAARRSRTALRTWAARIPDSARVDVTSLRGFGNARQTATVAAELTEVPSVAPWRRRPHVPGQDAPQTAATLRSANSSLARAERTRRGAETITTYPDTEIQMTRRRLPGWLPPDPAQRPRWRLPEMRRFLITAGRNRAGADGSANAEVWEAFLRRIGQDSPVSAATKSNKT